MKATPSSTLRKIARRPQVAPVVQTSDAPVMIALPLAPGQDDSAMIFRSRLLRVEVDGCKLRAALDEMVAHEPRLANKVIMAASLGAGSYDRAVTCLRGYLETGEIVAPLTF